MTTAIPVAQLQDQAAARAREAQPGHALATAFAAIFVAIGWVVGRLVLGTSFAIVSVRYGYWRGKGLSDADIAARVQARAAAQAPEPA